MALTAPEVRKVISAARGLSFDAPEARVEAFIGATLGLNVIQVGQYFPSPDPAGLLSMAVGHLTTVREEILRDECSIPTFAVYESSTNSPVIAGFNTYLASRGSLDGTFRNRLTHHADIRAALLGFRRGHNLEAVAAAILDVSCEYGAATRGSGDQGIDAIGWKELMLIDPSFCEGSISVSNLPGDRVILLASSKATTSGAASLINPAHIRELVGGWLIQRSDAGMWREVGIRMLTPVQLILVTTYRLSDAAKAQCRTLGVQVWGLPELIYLICKFAPTPVFDAANGFSFERTEFRRWWKPKDLKRLAAA